MAEYHGRGREDRDRRDPRSGDRRREGRAEGFYRDGQKRDWKRSEGFSKSSRGPRQERDDRRGRAPERRGDRPVGSRYDARQGEDRRRDGRDRDARRSDERSEHQTRGAGPREGYRASRPKAPDFDDDVTGKELDRSVHRELGVLERDNAEAVAKHLVMTSRYLEVDPDFAYEHAQAAVRRAGRISAVREAAAIAAYAAEKFDVALRELRTHRRMTGSSEHLPLIVDSERALGRTAKALETAADPSALAELSSAAKAELAMVVSGIHRDQGELKQARRDLEIPELNPKRAFSYSSRLFSAYAEILEQLGEQQQSAKFARLAVLAEAALGQGQFAEPEIFEIDVLPDPQPEEGLDLTGTDEQQDLTSTDDGEESIEEDDALVEVRDPRIERVERAEEQR